MMGEFTAYDYSCWFSAISGMISIIHQAIPWNVRPVVVEKWKKCRSLGWRDKSSRLDVLVELEPLWISLEISNNFHSHLPFNYWMLYHGLDSPENNPPDAFFVLRSLSWESYKSQGQTAWESHLITTFDPWGWDTSGMEVEWWNLVCESCEVYPTEDSHVLPQKRDQFKKEVNHHLPIMDFQGIC